LFDEGFLNGKPTRHALAKRDLVEAPKQKTAGFPPPFRFLFGFRDQRSS
jgi:hypothetical protein